MEPSPSDEIITGAERLTMEGVMYASSHFRGMVSSSLAFRLERLREKKKHKMKEADGFDLETVVHDDRYTLDDVRVQGVCASTAVQCFTEHVRKK